jgi:hypothetical protein
VSGALRSGQQKTPPKRGVSSQAHGCPTGTESTATEGATGTTTSELRISPAQSSHRSCIIEKHFRNGRSKEFGNGTAPRSVPNIDEGHGLWRTTTHPLPQTHITAPLDAPLHPQETQDHSHVITGSQANHPNSQTEHPAKPRPSHPDAAAPAIPSPTPKTGHQTKATALPEDH